MLTLNTYMCNQKFYLPFFCLNSMNGLLNFHAPDDSFVFADFSFALTPALINVLVAVRVLRLIHFIHMFCFSNCFLHTRVHIIMAIITTILINHNINQLSNYFRFGKLLLFSALLSIFKYIILAFRSLSHCHIFTKGVCER